MAWFSILIPSWNNLPYLRLCVESLRRHSAGEKARGDYVLYLNDDMVAAPGWDTALERALERVCHHAMFTLSGTMHVSRL